MTADGEGDKAAGAAAAAAVPFHSDCGSSVAMPYFISFVVIGTFVFLNLVLAVILEEFISLYQRRMEGIRRREQNLPELVDVDDVTEFHELWSEYDLDATGFMPKTDLPKLVVRVDFPLGVERPNLDDDGPPVRLLRAAVRRTASGGVAGGVVQGRSAATDADESSDDDDELHATRRWMHATDDHKSDAEEAVRICLALKGVRPYDREGNADADGDMVKFEEVLNALMCHGFEKTCNVESPARQLLKNTHQYSKDARKASLSVGVADAAFGSETYRKIIAGSRRSTGGATGADDEDGNTPRSSALQGVFRNIRAFLAWAHPPAGVPVDAPRAAAVPARPREPAPAALMEPEPAPAFTVRLPDPHPQTATFRLGGADAETSFSTTTFRSAPAQAILSDEAMPLSAGNTFVPAAAPSQPIASAPAVAPAAALRPDGESPANAGVRPVAMPLSAAPDADLNA